MADRLGIDLGREFLRTNFGSGSDLYSFLERYTMDTASWLGPNGDDFMGDTLHGGYQSTASGAASVAAAISTGVVNGAILLDAGTDNAGRSDLSLGLHFRGDQNAMMIARVTLATITTCKAEIGFTDVISGTDAGAVNVKATPTFTATDCAVWCLDTNNNANWEGLGNAAGVAATTLAAGISPVAATYEYLGVALLDGDAYYTRWSAAGKKTYGPTRQASAITKTVLLTPWLFVQNRSAASHTMTVDWLGVWQRRTT